jgi:predicted NUDIX family NTP pyrophosphohydrolase
MSKRSAGILAYRYHQQQLEVLLVHPGGPFYAKKDDGVWSIPKGEYNDGEDPLTVARREFEEETGNLVINQHVIALTPVKLKSGKIISAWASEENFEQCFIRSNTFEMEWPPKSGKMQSFPEVDKAGWFSILAASIKIPPAQVPLLKELEMILHLKGMS